VFFFAFLAVFVGGKEGVLFIPFAADIYAFRLVFCGILPYV